MATPVQAEVHQNNFNFLRIFAALLVAVSHSFYITGNEASEPLGLVTGNYVEFSSIGLFIFFFTSGYLVKRSAENSRTPLVFLKKRGLRIYPALILVVLISVFFAGPLLTSLPATTYFTHPITAGYLWTLSGFKIRYFLPGVYEGAAYAVKGFNGSLWSIRLELTLYLTLFLLLTCKWIYSKMIMLMVSLLVMCSCIVMYYFEWYNNFLPDHKHLMLTASFYLGVLMNTVEFKKQHLFAALLVSGLLLLCRSLQLITINLLFDQVVFFSLLTYIIAFTSTFSVSVKNDISYGVYIYTFPLQQFFFQATNFNHAVMLNLLLSLACSAFVSFLSWKYIEKPSLKYKNSLQVA